MAEDDWHSDDDDDKGSLGRDVVNTLHFGGGMVATKGPSIYGPGEGDDKAPKNRLDALQEIVAKSKMFKLQKKEAKEEQENDREKLDKDFQDLVSGSMLDFQPKKRDRSQDKGANDAIDEYDTSLRSMAFEVKARPSDRTKSDEEKAVEARTRLEDLEAARLRRMNSAMDPQDNAEAEKALNHGDFKKRKRMTDDEVDGSFGSNYAKHDDDEEEEEEEGDDEEEQQGDVEEKGDDEEDNEEDDDEDDWEDEDAEATAAEPTTKTSQKSKSKKAQNDEDIEDEDLGDLDGEDDEEEEGDNDEEDAEKDEEEKEEVEVLSDRVLKKLKKADKAVEHLAAEGETQTAQSILSTLFIHRLTHCYASSTILVTLWSIILFMTLFLRLICYHSFLFSLCRCK
jgi:nucleolar protein 14